MHSALLARRSEDLRHPPTHEELVEWADAKAESMRGSNEGSERGALLDDEGEDTDGASMMPWNA